MRRELIQNTKVAPYTSGAAIDRLGFFSAILAVAITKVGELTLTFTHCDTAEGTYETVKDTHFVVDDGVVKDGTITLKVEAGDSINIDIDLVGCKQFIKVTASGDGAAGANFAYAIGDAQNMPV